MKAKADASALPARTSRSGALCAALSLCAFPAFTQAAALQVADLADLSLEQLADIVVTSVSRQEENLSASASAIQVITREDIRRSGASSLPEALRLANNLQVAQDDAQSWVITARGFSSDVGNKLLVMIDGRTVYTPLFSGVFWGRQDYLLEDIERIEVISGPGSTLWGSNAVNGVINIITRRAGETQGLYAETRAGTELRGAASLRYGGELAPDVHYRVYGQYSERDGSAFPDGSDVHDAWDMAQAGFRIDASPSGNDAFTVQGDVYRNDAEVATGGSSRVKGANLLGRWTRRFSSDADMSLQFYYDRTDLRMATPAQVVNGLPLAAAGEFGDRLDTFDVDFQQSWRSSPRNRVIWGLAYRHTRDDVDNSPGLAFLPEELEQDLYSAFVQDEFALVPERLTLTLGSKFEHNDYTGWETVPSARLHWSVSDAHSLWAAVSRAVRIPSRIDRDLSQPAPDQPPLDLVLLAGGPNFRSETVRAWEAGHRARIGERLTTSLALFYNEYDDLRSTSLSPLTIFPLFFENNLEGETHGFELRADYQARDWWRLSAGFTLLREDLRVKSGRFDFNNALNETADPEHQLSLRSAMDLLGDVALDFHLRWVDELTVNNAGVPDRVPAYAELNARLAWSPTERIELSLTGQNLLDSQHPEFSVTTPQRQEIERSVYGKVAWRF